MLAVTNMETRLVRDSDGLKTVPANVATFRVGDDGKLTFARSYGVDTHGQSQFWSGVVALS
jgi:6-phosphogluconolactonase